MLDSTKLTGASRGKVEADLSQSSRAGRVRHRRRPTRRDRLFYVSTVNLCMDWQSSEAVVHPRHAVRRRRRRPTTSGPGGYLGAFIAWDAVQSDAGLGDQGEVPGLERRAGDRGRRGVLRHARRMVQGGGREDRRGHSGNSGSGRAWSGAPITYRGPGREAVRRGVRGHRRRLVPPRRATSGRTIPPTCAPRPTSCPTSRGIPAREASYGCLDSRSPRRNRRTDRGSRVSRGSPAGRPALGAAMTSTSR